MVSPLSFAPLFASMLFCWFFVCFPLCCFLPFGLLDSSPDRNIHRYYFHSVRSPRAHRRSAKAHALSSRILLPAFFFFCSNISDGEIERKKRTKVPEDCAGSFGRTRAELSEARGPFFVILFLITFFSYDYTELVSCMPISAASPWSVLAEDASEIRRADYTGDVRFARVIKMKAGGLSEGVRKKIQKK